jgi:hypothetical protein
METDRRYGCSNFPIVYEVHRSSEFVRVRVGGIGRVAICAASLGPATASDPMAFERGRHLLQFAHLGRIDEYEVTITDDAIAVDPLDAEVTAPLARLTWRYPRKSFAYFGGTTTQTSWICDAFLDSLLSTGRFREFVFPDSGDIPYPRVSSGYHYNIPPRYFRYATEADYDTAGAILGRLSRDVIAGQSGISLCLRNWLRRHYCT